jgi:hypothetical protein
MTLRLTTKQQRAVINFLRQYNLIGHVWPVYKRSRLEPVEAALVSASFMVQQIRAIGGGSGLKLTERQLNYLLKSHRIDPYPSGLGASGVEEKLIARHRVPRSDSIRVLSHP